MEIPKGYCQCGCGEKTSIAKLTNSKRGHTKGEPVYFIYNHHARINKKFARAGMFHPKWRGGKTTTVWGYVKSRVPDHPRADSRGYVYEHILVVEKALGKPFPHGARVHHVDGNRANNVNSNLVLCQDHGYHLFLHRRQKALKAKGLGGINDKKPI